MGNVMSEERVPVPGEFYKHFKNKLYQIREIAYFSETQEKMVVYQAMYDDFRVYVRPYDMFMSEVDHLKYPDIRQKYRFEKVEIGNVSKADHKQAENGLQNRTSISDNVSMIEDPEGDADPRLLQFLDADNFQEKLNVLTSLRSKLDDRLINDISTSLDITVEEGPLDKRYESLRNCLLAHVKYECNRLR